MKNGEMLIAAIFQRYVKASSGKRGKKSGLIPSALRGTVEHSDHLLRPLAVIASPRLICETSISIQAVVAPRQDSTISGYCATAAVETSSATSVIKCFIASRLGCLLDEGTRPKTMSITSPFHRQRSLIAYSLTMSIPCEMIAYSKIGVAAIAFTKLLSVDRKSNLVVSQATSRNKRILHIAALLDLHVVMLHQISSRRCQIQHRRQHPPSIHCRRL